MDFVADGYVNRRVIVLDTGQFKRLEPDGPGPKQFNLVHGVRVSDDGLVYVADRRGNRIQVFTIDGTFQREIFVERNTRVRSRERKAGAKVCAAAVDGPTSSASRAAPRSDP